MNLIEEIELAATAYSYANDTQTGECAYLLTVTPRWWGRIKAALEAAQEMDKEIVRRNDYQPSSIQQLNKVQRKFRKAMNGA